LGEIPENPCPLCETHGDVMDPTLTDATFEGDDITERLRRLLESENNVCVYYMELPFKDTLIFYQTGLRNVGLYTSISLALLGSSRFYRGKGNSVYNISFLIISVVALLLAISLLQNLISNITMFRKTLKSEEQTIIDEWMKIPTSLNYALMLGVLGLSVYTVYRQL